MGRRIILAIFYIFLLGGVVYGISLLRKPADASCVDGIKNQGEEEIDCGGPCRSCEEAKKLGVFEVSFIPTKENFVDVIAEVRNDNISYGIAQFSYTFELYDRENNLVAAKKGNTFILPNSTKFIIEQAVNVTNTPEKVQFHFANPEFREVKGYIKPRLQILSVRRDLVGEKDNGMLRVQGNLVNQTNFDLDKAFIIVLLRDERGETVGVNKQEVKTLLSNEDRFFDMRWFYRVPHFTVIDTAADTNIFEESNYLKFLK